ncbi:MAG: alanyl-tRNA synthetase [Phycisphaerales bacterium]|jgi:alanyl-tRNA synthetase
MVPMNPAQEISVPVNADLSASAVRQRFLDFFEKRSHTPVPSSTTVPTNDPSLRDTFANAGMNQYKPIFLGQVQPGSYLEGLTRATNTQKCIRAGGKHNDLDDVGKDTYHHTFFEMLGNWSFGDYFKAETIEWAWQFFTNELGLDPTRLYASYFGGDEQTGLEPDHEAKNLWLRHLPPGHVLPFGMKDNFWEMGETGPCGPCSEIHYDRVGGRDASSLVNADDPNVLELWNLVFIQYERLEGGKLRSLPAKHVDTGLGLERIVSVLQDKPSNYDTDLFTPIFDALQKATGARAYSGKLGDEDTDGIDEAYRVIADHARCLTIAITDGGTPSNEGRGYVLRRILRRAVRYGRQKLGANEGFLADLVPVVVEILGDAFPELKKNPRRVAGIIREEETSFGKTLEKGIGLFEEFASESKGVISGADAFKLYDTYGFPFDLTQLMAQERGLTVDLAGYEAAMAEQQKRSRAGGRKAETDKLNLGPEDLARLATLQVKPTDDSHKFHAREIRATVKAIWNGHNFDDHARQASASAHQICVVLDRTNFYAEMGGQVADHGRVVIIKEHKGINDSISGGEFRVEDVRSFGNYIGHIGRVCKGELRVGDGVVLHIDANHRHQVSANHTATHILNHKLRTILEADCDQRGSLVASDKLRFDFAHNSGVDAEQLAQIEEFVCDEIEADLPVYAEPAPLEKARSIAGLRAVFDETYPDPVRVVSIGNPVGDLLASPSDKRWPGYSAEFCGGTHLQRTGEAGQFALISEEGIAKGIRRITAVTGVAAQAAIAAADRLATDLAAAETASETELPAVAKELAEEIDLLTLPAARKARLKAKLETLQDRVKKAQKGAAANRAAQAQQQAQQIAATARSNPDQVVISTIELGPDRKALEAAMSTVESACPTQAVMLLSTDPDSPKVAVLACVPKSLVDRGLRAGDWIRETTAALGGKGGGRPERAQGGADSNTNLKEAIAVARHFAHSKIT